MKTARPRRAESSAADAPNDVAKGHVSTGNTRDRAARPEPALPCSTRRRSFRAMRVLLAEDDSQLRASIMRGLREASFAVDPAGTGAQALSLATANEYDAIILDVLLPGKSGIIVCRAIRERGNQVPILMLTALDAVEHRIAGLDSGADDYLTKPFDFGELLARLRALTRRRGEVMAPRIVVGDLVIDTLRHSVSRRRPRHRPHRERIRVPPPSRPQCGTRRQPRRADGARLGRRAQHLLEHHRRLRQPACAARSTTARRSRCSRRCAAADSFSKRRRRSRRARRSTDQSARRRRAPRRG